ncbi:MAG: TldD/PmbA family protein, partial [Halanaerobiaceae bacterium]
MLKKNVIKEALSTALKTGGDFAEIYVEDTHNTTLKMVKGDIERANSGRDYGVGIRIFNGNNAIYAYTNNTSRKNLLSVAGEASRAIKNQEENIVFDLTEKKVKNNHPISVYPDIKNQKEKVDLMRYAHESVENYNELINQIIINYMDQVKKVQIANSEGLLTEDKRIRTRTSIYVVATKDGEKQTGNFSPGAHKGFEFYDEIDLAEYAREAANTAITMINADFIPGQKMPVVINNKFGGVIFHEACGHGLEATSVAKNTSVFADKLGEKVASEKVTAIDDGTIPNAWGSQNIDD